MDKDRWILPRVIDSIREIGVLQVTFAPLDAALEFGHGSHATGMLALAFLLEGLCFFGCSLLLEWSYVRVR